MASCSSAFSLVLLYSNSLAGCTRRPGSSERCPTRHAKYVVIGREHTPTASDDLPQIREGMTVVNSIPDLPTVNLDRQIILNIFSSIGRCRFLDEKHFDACTALSGSGPAFACIFLEAMADGGVMMGLPRAEALELAAQSEWVRPCDTRHA